MAVPAADKDLINFDIIESHKENIQSLPGGRSAKQLAAILSPLPVGRPTGRDQTPTLEETKTLNDAIRQEYEIELQSIADSDDPLDIYDRYVKWTLNAYPSAQATPQSQLLPLLERATKSFLTSSNYKNDPRYLKLWLHYIRLFSDSPRETFAFLARHGIGEGLGLFYEEFAVWLESAGRWVQAEEVYKLGLEREARPTEKLARKYAQFQQRFDSRPQVDNEPSSPALPTVRPALAAKIDPFAAAPRSDDPQAGRQGNRPGSAGAPTTSRSGKPKMAIFSDADSAPPPPAAASSTNGWDSIGSMKERKKENTVETRPWAGEKLKAGGRVGTVPKMEIFKDPTRRDQSDSVPAKRTAGNSKQSSETVNPRTGRAERVFVDLEAIYPSGHEEEFSFEELRAMSRQWTQKVWGPHKEPMPSSSPLRLTNGNAIVSPQSKRVPQTAEAQDQGDIENLSQSLQQKMDLNDNGGHSMSIHDVSTQSMVGMPESESSQSQSQIGKPKEKRLKIREVKQETQTVKTRLESPSGKKLKRKNTSTAEPTMTFHSKAATNEIYDMFNQPLRRPELERDDTQSGDDTDFTEGEVDDGYSTTGDAESTGTGRMSAPGSEFGDDTLASQDHTRDQSQPESVSPWSDFTASKHVPRLSSKDNGSGKKGSSSKSQRKTQTKHKDRHVLSDDMTESMDSSSQNPTQMSGFDTQAIAAIAGANFEDMDTKAIAMIADANFEDMDTKAIAMIAGDMDDEDEEEDEERDDVGELTDAQSAATADEIGGAAATSASGIDQPFAFDNDNAELAPPVDDMWQEQREIPHKPRFIPIPPVDYEPTPNRPYRDPTLLAQNKIPFMTPIAERTESSLAPSTIFNAPGYFDSKTPSRAKREDDDSPSKTRLENLSMSSPQRPEGTPTSSAKRKYHQPGATEEEVATSSPTPKKVLSYGQDPVAEQLFPGALTSPMRSTTLGGSVLNTPALPTKIRSPVRSPLAAVTKGPIVADLQCNPCDDSIRQQILSGIHPPTSAYKGYHDHSPETSGRYQSLKSFAEKVAKTKVKASPRKSQSEKTLTKAVPPLLKFPGASRVYAVKRELGEGAFAPVYLVDSYDPDAQVDEGGDEDKENCSPHSTPGGATRQALEALKTEAPPGTLVWEFHILRLVKQRLGPSARAMKSIILAHECHLYRDEAYIVLSYSPQGTLLDLVNLARSENVKAGKPAEGLDETLAMWFSVELLRTMEDLHRVGILHGDLKGDNCLVRFDSSVDMSSRFDPEGDHGWGDKGITLIDFGRGIDVRMFKGNAQFIADWPSSAQDCAEIRECRPWKWQIDYHGAAGVIHSLLFGKYIETVPAASSSLGPGQRQEWKLKENLKRYWEKELWGEVFGLLLNPGSVEDREEMPIQGNLRRLRVKMERWLMEEGEKGSRDLRGSLKKMERLVCGK